MNVIIEIPKLDFSRRLKLELNSRDLMRDGQWLVSERPALAPEPQEYKQPMAVMPIVVNGKVYFS